ncbi:DUF4179 domain-containing protein [Desulfosporosinus nitroreducens]|uniref:DUF4179 domain-containing protein n=1 Tax=Desulfosporosinus nitroreducens TaxID=2018668 RepID=UPI00207D318F|nr:DUF4179 domain-containing protein [Desulfosporosinus nitroreducens]MCO1604221.1 DUF4179 domain-containing protein [Desulfosporosinus nitroreducens]
MFDRKELDESHEGKKRILSNSETMDESVKMDESDTMDDLEKLMNEFNAFHELEDGVNQVHDQLIQATPRVADMPIPTELDDHIQKGLTKGIKAQKVWHFRKWTTLVACFLMVAFITTARVSPAVAAVLHQIPGLGYIVELINYDKGLQSAVENDFILPLGVSEEHENIVFTVDGIIMDEASLVIFYTVENKRGEGTFDFSEVRLFDEMGEPLKEISIGHSSSGEPDEDGDGKIQSRINVNFYDNTVIPNRLSLKVKLREIFQDVPFDPSSQLPSTWEITIPVDKDKFVGMKTVYEVNQSVVIEGQRITFEKVTVYPTRMALNVSYDPANSKKIFAFDDLTLVNEEGEEWGSIINGVSGSYPDENRVILFFQSTYFTQSRKLFLQGKSLRAMDKESLRITLDLEQERILVGPPNLVLDNVIKNSSEKEKELIFSLKTNPLYDEKRGFCVFPFEFIDARGNSFEIKGQSTATHSDKPGYDKTLWLTLPDNQSYQSPITFQIQDYPSRITGEFDIRIK